MARSKTLYPLTWRFPVQQQNNPAGSVVDQQIDLSVKLSEKLGRTIRQGQSFRIVGISSALTPMAGEDLDTGMSAVTRVQYCPTTKWSSQAWRDMLGHYNKQKAFRNGLGGSTKYDEFEVAWTRINAEDRTSMVYVGGLNDPTPEFCAIYGPYDDEDGVGSPNDPGVISLQALCNAKHRVPGSSEAQGGTWGLSEDDWLFDDMIEYKAPKFSSRFPRADSLFTQCEMSTMLFHEDDPLIDDIYTAGAAASGVHTFLPDDNHVNALTGCLHVQSHVLHEDTIHTVADGMYLYVTLWVEGWNSLTRGKR